MIDSIAHRIARVYSNSAPHWSGSIISSTF